MQRVIRVGLVLSIILTLRITAQSIKHGRLSAGCLEHVPTKERTEGQCSDVVSIMWNKPCLHP